ncbi:thiol reductant ABC exporter subunit CydD [Neisseriaceae bacterium ESL0693]|nr:thiol reductant ABC exporter subunit CydD [Neisseriaceae bacterium ESL0693]
MVSIVPTQANPPKSRLVLQTWLQPQRPRLRLAYALAIGQGVLLVLQNGLLAWLFAGWLNGQPVLSHLIQILPYLLLCWAARPWLEYIKNQQLAQASIAIRANLRLKLIQTLADLGEARRHLGHDGALSSLILDQVDALDGYIVHYVIQQKIAVMMPLLIVVVTACYSPLAAILLLLTAPLVPVFMILVGEAAARKSRAQFAALARLSGRFLDLLRGLATLRRLGALNQAQEAVDQATQQYRRRTMQVLKLAFLSTAILELFSALAIALVAVYLGLGLLGVLPWNMGMVPVPYQGALLILLLAPEFYAPLRQLGADYHAKASAEAAADAINQLLTTPTPHKEGSLDYRLQHAPAIEADQLGMMALGGRMRLAPVSFKVAAGERILLSGRSGSGKSSLLQALLGFAPFTGRLYLDHLSYQKLNSAFVRQFMAYLAQTPPLLPLTIAENLRLAQPQATDQELYAVLMQVGLWPLVAALPHTWHTSLAERGIGLSGGQLQRLALAQMLLRPAPLWLLDEPTAHLDAKTAKDVMRLIERLSRGKTVILVCHDHDLADWTDRTITLTAIEDKPDETC